MADSGHPPAELHERLLICRTIKLNAGALGGHRRCCHAKMQKNAQNKPQITRLILCVHTTLQVYCNLFLTFCANAGFLHRFYTAVGWAFGGFDEKAGKPGKDLAEFTVNFFAEGLDFP